MNDVVTRTNAKTLFVLVRSLIWENTQMGRPYNTARMRELEYLVDEMLKARPEDPAIDSSELWRKLAANTAPF